MIPTELQFVRIGRSRKSFGAGGQLRCTIDWTKVRSLNRGDFIFIEIDGIKIPFEIENINDADKPLLKLIDVNDPQSALLVTNKELFIEEKQAVLSEQPGAPVPFTHLIGYSVFDQTSEQAIGVISLVEEMPGQLMAIISREDLSDLLVPLAGDLMVEQDDQTKVLTMNLPEGMLDL